MNNFFLKAVFLCFSTILIHSCTNSNAESPGRISKLVKELDSTKLALKKASEELRTLKNSPDQRKVRAEMLFADEKYTQSEQEYQGIIDNFKGTTQAVVAEKKLKEIKEILKRKKAEEERKKALGYKILSPTKTVNYEGITIEIQKLWSGQNWSFDSHGDEWFYRAATRGNTHILARISITSKDKNPQLPPFMVYEMMQGKLHYTGALGYEFRRWKNYGSYLGNYADYGNDFAHSSTIPFNLGLQVAKEKTGKNNLYIVVKKKGCFKRVRNDFERPEVGYAEILCDEKKILELEDFEKDYVLIGKL